MCDRLEYQYWYWLVKINICKLRYTLFDVPVIENRNYTFYLGLSLENYMIIMSDKLVAADEDENIRHTFMAFDTNCKFEMNRILSYIIFFFHLYASIEEYLIL